MTEGGGASVKCSSLIGSLGTYSGHAGKTPPGLACAVGENERLTGEGSGGRGAAHAQIRSAAACWSRGDSGFHGTPGAGGPS